LLSPTSRCRFGDAGGDGFVRSEGAGIVVLKKLAHALRDGDQIYAVIRGSAVNSDGRTGGTLVKPGVEGQTDMLRSAYDVAQVRPEQVGYIECHGTGTPEGDPIELKAIANAICAERQTQLLVGSTKTNIGHTESASGIAGLIKAALCVGARKIPASLHFHKPNPGVAWDEWKLKVPTALCDWPAEFGSVIAGVSAFGVTGTNAHVVLEEPPPQNSANSFFARSAPSVTAHDSPNLLLLSAHTKDALKDTIRSWRDFLENPNTPLTDVCYTAACRRTALDWRLAVVGQTAEELSERLGERLDEVFSQPQETSADERKPVFVCSGQGPRFWPIDEDLLASHEVFRDALSRCDEQLRSLGNFSIIELLRSPNSELTRTEFAQPALCALQIAVAELWRSWGVEPQAVIGHSMGEVTAACIAGALSLEDAMKVIYHRGRLLQTRCGLGKMALIAQPRERVQTRLSQYPAITIATTNSPTSTVVSGDTDQIVALVEQLQAEDVFCRVLESVDFASHSEQMQPIQEELCESLAEITPVACRIPFMSTVVARFIDGEELDGRYWADNVRQPVLFADAADRLAEGGYRHFLEVGAHPVLLQSIQQCFQHRGETAEVVGSLQKDVPAEIALRAACGGAIC